jgi:hypothetical protein
MKNTFFLTLIFIIFSMYINCSPPQNNSYPVGPTYSTVLPVTQDQSNIVPISVGCGYVNEPCVTVTICIPGTSQCQTIPNVLLDTGSYGLRLFSSVTSDWYSMTPLISLPLLADPNNSAKTIAECVSYADGSADWGPVATADVLMGGETARSVSIQIINANFSQVPSSCPTPDTDPISAGFNGILGVGLFAQDCGLSCDSTQGGTNNNSIYFSCKAGGVCHGTGVVTASQVTNPVAKLSVDNNGVIVALTTNVPDTGATSVTGYLIFGIGTSVNNSPAGTTSFPTDGSGNFSTSFNGTSYGGSFIDSGSNGLYFPQPSSLATCSNAPSFYCPSSQMSFSATQNAVLGTASNQIFFNVANANTELSDNNTNMVFNNLAGPFPEFDWGLPFFLGRNIFVGLEGQTSPLGTGPYWAY